MNRKAAYVDFNQPEYKSLSDDEVQTLKKINSIGDKKQLRNCKTHGLVDQIFFKSYDKDYNETNYFGCPKCLKQFGK